MNLLGQPPPAPKRRVTQADIGTWLAAMWALAGIRHVPDGDGTHDAFERLLSPEADPRLAELFNFRFRIYCDPLSGGSETVREILRGVAARGLGYYSSPPDGLLHLSLGEAEARRYVGELSPEEFEVLSELAILIHADAVRASRAAS